jgi:hypothetical protein
VSLLVTIDDVAVVEMVSRLGSDKAGRNRFGLFQGESSAQAPTLCAVHQ